MPSVRHALRARPGSTLECARCHDGGDEAVLIGIRPRELDAAVTRGLEVVQRGVDGLEGLPDVASDRQTLPQATQELTSNLIRASGAVMVVGSPSGSGRQEPLPVPLPHACEAAVVAVPPTVCTAPTADRDAASPPHRGGLAAGEWASDRPRTPFGSPGLTRSVGQHGSGHFCHTLARIAGKRVHFAGCGITSSPGVLDDHSSAQGPRTNRGAASRRCHGLMASSVALRPTLASMSPVGALFGRSGELPLRSVEAEAAANLRVPGRPRNPSEAQQSCQVWRTGFTPSW
jgi:hypothetical protein